MSAIFGVAYTNGNHLEVEKIIGRVAEALTHRGEVPAVERWDPGIVIGGRYFGFENQCARVASNAAKEIRVAFDGDIFSPDSCDAQNIVALYEEKGEGFPDGIDGPFSVALHDCRKKKLLLVRDRLGARPLFYTHVYGTFLFGSDVKAILASGLVERSVDVQALNAFLSYGYVPNPDTLIKGVRQVRPGHMIIWEEGRLREVCYWRYTCRQAEGETSEEEYIRQYLSLLEEAIARRVRKYPSAGAFLSGGMDTSAVAAVMKKLTGSPFTVFTAGFNEEKYNEIDDAKVVADHLGLKHHTIIVDQTDLPALIEKIIWLHDHPFYDTSAVPSFFAAQLAKQYTDVVLTGDFPDQILGGSGHHVKTLAHADNRSFTAAVLPQATIGRLIAKFPLAAATTSFFDKALRKLYYDSLSPEERCIALRMIVPELLKRKLYSPEMKEINRTSNGLEHARALYRDVSENDLLTKLLYFDVKSYACEDLMVKVERMTTAHGLWAVSPFHDRKLVEFSAGLPSHLKINGTVRKYILRKAVGPLLPSHTLNKKKQGFAMPLDEWLTGPLAGYAQGILLDRRAIQRGYFDKRCYLAMIDDYFKGKTDYASGSSYTVFALLTLELWHRLFVDKQMLTNSSPKL